MAPALTGGLYGTPIIERPFPASNFGHSFIGSHLPLWRLRNGEVGMFLSFDRDMYRSRFLPILIAA